MKTGTKTHRDSPSNGGNGIGIVTAALKAQLTMVISGVLLLLCFCGIAYSMDDPDSVTKPLSLCALFLSALCGGFSAVRLSGDGLVSGLCAGAFTALIVFVLSALPVSDSGMELADTLLMYLGILAAAAVGSIIGKRRKDTSRNKIRSHISRKRKT